LFEETGKTGSAAAQRAAASPGYTASILRHLVKVTAAKWDAAEAKAKAAPGAGAEAGEPGTAAAAEAADGRALELSLQFDVASERLSALGVTLFAGADEEAAARELAWFAHTAWNAGLAAAAGGRAWDAVARLFSASGAFLLAPGTPQAGGSPQLAFLLSAAAWLEVHSASGEASALAAARRAVASHAAITASGGAAAGRVAVFALLINFATAARAGDEGGCAELLRSAEAMAGLSGDSALKLAKLSAAPGAPRAACEKAHALCLRVLQRSPGGAPAAELAYALRKSLQLQEEAGGTGGGGADGREPRLLRAWREAAALLAGVPAGGYPPDEAAWLVTHCWNRGAGLAKLGRCVLS